MENEEKNIRPEEPKNTTPTIVLIVLFSIVLLLLYAGWNLMSDDSTEIAGMESIEQVDTDLVTAETPPEANESTIRTIDPVKEVTPQPTPEPKEEKKPNLPKAKYSGETAIHTVKSGETFFKIAQNFNTSTELLEALNPEINPSTIKVGITKVNVPVQAVHTVGPGDILRVVSNKYGVSIDALMKANNKDKNHAQRGEKLLIPHTNKI